MRGLIFAAALLPSIATAGVTCSAIPDSDQRAYCRAVQSQSRGQCEAIVSYDFRQACYARLGAPKSVCATVSPGFARLACQDAKKAGR